MRVAFLIAAKDLRQRLRDRSALLTAIVAPLGLAVIFSQLLGGVTGFNTTWVVVNLDGGDLANVLRVDVIGALERGGVAVVHDAPTEAAGLAAVDDGTDDVAFIIPPGFSDDIRAGEPVTLRVVGARDEALSTEIARSVAQRFGDGVVAVQLSVETVQTLVAPSLPPAEKASRSPRRRRPPRHRLRSSTSRRRSASSACRPTSRRRWRSCSCSSRRRSAWSACSGSDGWGRWRGSWQGPSGRRRVLVGKTLAAFLMGIVAMTTLVVATTLLIDADWGPPLGVAAMVVAGIISAIGIATLVTSFAHTAASAAAANGAVAITLGILGGTFAPSAQAPEVLATLSLLTPHGWFLRGLGDMHGTGSTAADCLPAVAVLLTMGLVTGGLGMLRARRLVAPR